MTNLHHKKRAVSSSLAVNGMDRHNRADSTSEVIDWSMHFIVVDVYDFNVSLSEFLCFQHVALIGNPSCYFEIM